jgi:hypothetical protein
MSAPPKDIVERIRGLRYVHVPVASELMNDAATAIETLRWQLTIRENIIGRLVDENGRLRNGAVTGCETVCPHVRGTVTQHCSLNFTLTDEEREAIEWFAEVRKPLDSLDGGEYVATVRKLLGRTNQDAVPAARAAEPESSVPLGSGAALANTQTAPPSKGEGLSEAEIDALEYVVEEGRIACMDDYGILRSLLVRVRPEWETADSLSPFAKPENDSPQPDATPKTHATPGDGSVQGEGTVGERLVERFSITHTMLDDNEKLRAEIATLREAVRRLADQDATLSVQDGSVTVTMDEAMSEAEIDAIECVAEDGRIARSLLVRVRPGWEAASKPEPPPRRCYSCGCTVDNWFYMSVYGVMRRQFCRNCYDRGVR